MRLTCPNCGAIYALGAETMPQGGSHVQCGACHTRWFARGERPAAAELSEDQIVARLESRAARSGGASGGDEGPAIEPSRSAPIAFPGPMRPVEVATAAQPGSSTDRARERAGAEPGPALSPAAAREPGPAVAATPLRPRQSAERPAPSLSHPAGKPPAAAARRSAAPAIGFLTAIGLAALGLAAYLRADAVTAQAPPAAGAVAAYVAAVDAGRGWIETRLGPARDRLFGD